MQRPRGSDEITSGSAAPGARHAEQYPKRLAATDRKRQGAWFTPLALALPTAERTLAPLLTCSGATAGRSLRIVDPAVGGGAFLLAALRTLVARGTSGRDAVVCLHGVDTDAPAARLAAAALHEACGDDAPDPDVIDANVRTGDGLVDLDDGTFDAVLTNPPWETLQASPDAAARVAELRPRFRHQGRGKLYTYRLFVERALRLLRPGGRFGFVVPASLWFDRDAEPLRRLLLDQCTWEWLFGFENRCKVFDIDSRYRFGVLVGTKGGRTDVVRVAFGRTDLAEWTQAAPPHACYGRDELAALSPHSGAFVEIDDRRDLEVLERMHRNGRPLLGDDGAFAWRQGDFNMTSDRAHFVPRAEAEATGYRRADDGTWRSDRRPDLLPLLQGAMIGDLHPNAGAHAGGTGHATTWESPRALDDVRPAFLLAAAPWRSTAAERPPARVVLRALSNATNERTAVACLVPDQPCGNSLGVLVPRVADSTPVRTMAALAAVLGSLPFDWSLRLRLAGTNLNGFVLTDCVLPRLDAATATDLSRLALRLCAVLPWHADLWRAAEAEGWHPEAGPALAAGEREALATRIDLLVGRAFGLSADDVAWIVRGCDLPVEALRAGRDGRLHAKGFWRIDRSRPANERRPRRWLVAAQA